MLECVINVSEGRDLTVIGRLGRAAGRCLLDLHRDADHHRSVLTLAGAPEEVEDAVRTLAAATLGEVDLRRHHGAHPRIGALDVVPWVSLSWAAGGGTAPPRLLVDGPVADAVSARDRFAEWAGGSLELPCFLYGPERSLPELRRQAWRVLQPDTGPKAPHPSAGATAVGARPLLVAYNLWLAEADQSLARRIAAELRGPQLRALGLSVGGRAQVSFNLVAPLVLGPATVFDAVATRTEVERAELVGLIPAAALSAVPTHRHVELDLHPSRTIEARLEQAGLDGGRFGDAVAGPGGRQPAAPGPQTGG